MTQVSHIPLRKEIENRVYEVLMESIASATDKSTVNKLIEDLLSPTERLMLAKRMSIALLLIKKYDQRTISKWLCVSLTTVNKVNSIINRGNGGYASMINRILTREKFNEMIRKIDDALAKILPPPSGNWRAYRKARRKEQRSDQKAF